MDQHHEVPGGSFLGHEARPEDVFAPEEFGAEARMMGQAADEFLRTEVLPVTERIEAHDVGLMLELMRKAGAAGLLGAEIPVAYGGLGLDNRTGALLAEKLNWQQSFALTHEAHSVIATMPLLFFGTDAQKRRHLPGLASGETIGAFCLSEPDSGSDARGARATASLSADGSHYVLNGTKMWITNSAFASLFTVFAKVDGQQFTAFLVEREYPGLSFGKEEHKLGMRGTSTRRVILDDVPVPIGNVIGEVGKGHQAAFCALNMGRFKIEAGAVGGLKETLGVCTRYAIERKQFGKPLADFGLIQGKLGEVAARTFALESAVYRLAGLLDGVFAGIDATAADAPRRYLAAASEYAIECNIVKVVGSELYSWATDEGIQIHGGYGYTEEFPMARAWRDQRLLRIGEGANEVVRLGIVRELLRRERDGRLGFTEPGYPPHGAPGDEDAVARLRGAALRLLWAAEKEYGEDLPAEQEVAAALADIVSATYVAQSAWARAEKMLASGAARGALAADAARVYSGAAADQAATHARAIAERLPEGSGRDTARAVARDLAEGWQRHDLIGLRRTLARACVERQGWPW